MFLVEENGSYLTSLQIKVIDALKANDGDLAMAAQQIEKSEQSIYNILFNIRKSRKKAQHTVNTVNNWMREPCLRRYLY